jgi:predicted membrane channel-forming protein YqfA (hemolysin III family)
VAATQYTASSLVLVQNEFLVNFIGIILGLAITLLTFIYSSFDKIYNSFTKNQSEEKTRLIQSILKHAFRELIQDTYLVMGAFGVIMILVIVEFTNIPIITWPSVMITRNEVLLFCKYFCFFLVCAAIFDMVISLLKMMNTIHFDNNG